MDHPQPNSNKEWLKDALKALQTRAPANRCGVCGNDCSDQRMCVHRVEKDLQSLRNVQSEARDVLPPYFCPTVCGVSCHTSLSS